MEGGEIEEGSCAPALIATQVLGSLLGIIIGAKIFVGAVESISIAIGISPVVLAFIIAPMATELPEKFNSILWYWRSKDALAMGNVTGAMVFQSSIPVSIGILSYGDPERFPRFTGCRNPIFGSKILWKNQHKAFADGGFLYFIYIFFIIFR